MLWCLFAYLLSEYEARTDGSLEKTQTFVYSVAGSVAKVGLIISGFNNSNFH